MTVSELAMEKCRQVDRDIAFDLMLDRAGRGFGEFFDQSSRIILILLIASQFWHFATLLPVWLPVAATPVTKLLAIVGAAAWLVYAMFAMRRRRRIERDLVQAQINSLRLQQLAAAF